MKVSIYNHSPLPYASAWCSILAPAEVVEDSWGTATEGRWGPEGQPKSLRVVRGSQFTKGLVTLHFEVRDIDGDATIRGEAEPLEQEPLPYRKHAWVDVAGGTLTPSVGVQVGGQVAWSSLVSIDLVETDYACTRWKLTSMLPEHGIVLEWWADVYHASNVLRFHALVTWSDRHDSNWNRQFDALLLKSGEPLSIEFSTAHNIANNFVRDAEGNYVVLLGTNLALNDGAALPLAGTMACLPQSGVELPEAETQEALENAQAARGGSLFGIVHAWQRHWGATGNPPAISASTAQAESALARESTTALLSQARGWFATRPMGGARSPGQTGNQPDFGACKGTLALYDPAHLVAMRYSVQADCFRGAHLFDAHTGQPIKASDHPGWVTWSGVTHYHSGVTQDRLGKEPPQPPATGWRGYDNQHRSQNLLAAYLHVCNDPAMLETARRFAQLDLADYRYHFPQNGAGAPRAIGRTLAAWAQLYSATGDEVFRQLIDATIPRARNQMMSLGNGAVMRVLGVLGPDARYPVYVEGQLSRAVSVWEHALAIVGLELARRVGTASTVWLDEIAAHVAHFLMSHAIFEDERGFALVNGVAWNDGDAVPGGMVRGNPALLLGDGGVTLWTAAGLLVARRVAPSHPNRDVVDRYLEIESARAPNDLEMAEWWVIGD